MLLLLLLRAADIVDSVAAAVASAGDVRFFVAGLWPRRMARAPDVCDRCA